MVPVGDMSRLILGLSAVGGMTPIHIGTHGVDVRRTIGLITQCPVPIRWAKAHRPPLLQASRNSGSLGRRSVWVQSSGTLELW